MKKASFTVDAPAILKEIASNLQGPNAWGNVGIIMGISMILGGLAQVAARGHAINDGEIIRLMNSMGITRGYIGNDLIELATSEHMGASPNR
jgi:hypothetical protein